MIEGEHSHPPIGRLAMKRAPIMLLGFLLLASSGFAATVTYVLPAPGVT